MSKHIRNADGLSHERLYSIYNGMINRCENPKVDNYERYGGRGISVCEEWRTDYQKFREWALKNGYADNLTIDRVDNDGNYEPSNCRWATRSMQNSNRRHLREDGYKHNWEIDGIMQSAEKWCRQYGVSVPTIMYRINQMGMTPKEALSCGGGRKNNTNIKTDDVVRLRNKGMSIKDIADTLKCSITTVNRRLGKAY